MVLRHRGGATAARRVGLELRAGGVAHDRGPAGLRRRRARRGGDEPARPGLGPRRARRLAARRGGGERRFRRRARGRSGVAAPLPDRRLPRRGVSHRLEAHGDVVPRGPRPRARDHGRRAHARLGRTPPRARARRARLARRGRGELAPDTRGRSAWARRRARGPLPVPAGALRSCAGRPRVAGPGRAARVHRLLRPHVGALCHVGLDRGLPRRHGTGAPILPGRRSGHSP